MKVSMKSQQGTSLIEVMIAALIILVVAVGIAPLILRARSDNVRGFELMQATNFAKNVLDPALQLPFEAPDLVIPDGTSELVAQDFWTPGEYAVSGSDVVETHESGWLDEEPTGAEPTILWNRTTRVEQFSITDLEAPLAGDVDDVLVHLKKVEVELRGARQAGALGSPVAYRVHVWKVF